MLSQKLLVSYFSTIVVDHDNDSVHPFCFVNDCFPILTYERRLILVVYYFLFFPFFYFKRQAVLL